VNPPYGCRFHPRCPAAMPHCGWEGRDLQKVLEDAIHQARPDSSLAGAVAKMETDEQTLRIRIGPQEEQSRAALESFLGEGRAGGAPMYQAIDEISTEDDGLVVSFRDTKEPELKEVKPGHAVACYLYE
jgi:peptide/nickel transport system ATP-binding protein